MNKVPEQVKQIWFSFFNQKKVERERDKTKKGEKK